MKKIKLPCFGIVVQLDDGGGSISSELHEIPSDDVEGGSEEDTANDRYDAAIDALESIILAHACAGVDIESPAYLEGIETAVEACANNF